LYAIGTSTPLESNKSQVGMVLAASYRDRL